ncbi:hypothetical protein DPMN_047004 [Dreissena polymorpha]|uniref:Uncharacterized protein n=1 Tax=Dreissena polymorpha TaxID=45954 RepID=A0A9D4D9L3_DREPO|nr:hypothetical protein DPMN_047004 [Dreissena polymorpha]
MSNIVPFAGTAAPAGLINVTDGAAVGVDYTLNMRMSLQKKLNSTDQEDVIVYETGEGFRLLLNPGMYELFKIAADQFFSNNTLPYKCCNVPVHDRQGNLVETQYKLSSGRQGIYTLNLYHTTSSCLINGKIHRPAMLKNIEERLINDETTTTDVKNALKKTFDVNKQK